MTRGRICGPERVLHAGSTGVHGSASKPAQYREGADTLVSVKDHARTRLQATHSGGASQNRSRYDSAGGGLTDISGGPVAC